MSILSLLLDKYKKFHMKFKKETKDSEDCLHNWLLRNDAMESIKKFNLYSDLYTVGIKDKNYFIKKMMDFKNEYKISKKLESLCLPTFQKSIDLLHSYTDIDEIIDNKNTNRKSHRKRSYYMISGKIEGIPLIEVMNELTRNELENILQVIFFSLRSAWTKFGFVHNDLHLNNIIIKKLNEPITLHSVDCEYKHSLFKFESQIVAEKYLPVLIDFEISSMYHNSKTIIHDIWKILGCLSLYLKDEKGELVLDYIEHFIDRNEFQERKEEFANEWFRIPPI